MERKNYKIKNILSGVLTPNKLFIAMFILLNVIIIYNTYLSKTRIESFFRVHVVANSDSVQDQILKYEVAEKVDTYISELTQNNEYTKEESKVLIESNIQNILQLCEQTISNKGYSYDVYANIGNIYYDEKQKDDVYMEQGIYDSLQIVIGNGKGANWWGLVFPYAYDGIVVENDNDDTTYQTKTDDTNHISTYDLVSSDNITVKFGFLELLSKLFNN